MKYLFYGLALLCITACDSGSEGEANPDDPSDLTMNVLVYDDGSGVVAVSATATNATEYQFFMGDADQTVLTDADGNIEFTYAASGNYTIEVRAYGPSGRYMKDVERIFVPAEEPVSIGEGYTTPITYEDYDLLWNDEFDGGSLDQSIWSYDNGDGCPSLCGWGNNELQWYRPDNSSFSNGVFTVEANQEPFQGRQYTSTKVVSRGKQAMLYGRADIRAIMPKGQGIWPAIWMLGTNQPSVGWPACGEIDIMEMIGGSGRENRVSANMYWEDNGIKNNPRGYTLPEGFLYDKYHVYSIIWTTESITWLIDDIEYHSQDITSPARTEFHSPFYMIMNVAVGGNWPGAPDDTTEFPTSMSVDYVRVFQEK